MMSLGAALASVLLAIIAAYYGLVNVGLDANLAAELAAAMTAAVPYVREFLEKTIRAQQGLKRAPVLSFGGFGLPPERMILYGTLIIVGAMELGSGLGAISVELLGETRDRETLYIMGIVGSLIQIPIIFSVGRWVGRRCASHGIVAIFLISFFARLATTLGDVWLMGSARMTQILGIHITPTTIGLLVAGGAILFVLIGLI